MNIVCRHCNNVTEHDNMEQRAHPKIRMNIRNFF